VLISNSLHGSACHHKGVVFNIRSTTYPPLSRKDSTGFCTMPKIRNPQQIRPFFTRFATDFHKENQQRGHRRFSSAFSCVFRALRSAKRAKSKRNPGSEEKSLGEVSGYHL
jgi:hypothetical protein